ncbi:hypothetical protein FB565_001584 [Actinoplanes lutulentus]|uniref:DUF4333 domain-containing protein n=1 Tax=Actinoplanes lutulentus TaxID=1287878 RepID=A0A327ZKV4_9ACTN|nr:hypothetical protein [Actinoplanes lutulentus]MBB2941880.1 hypothetical protein [Actinoplanes lutulentus]RAK39797.1 hypothetical protein B0I29_104336 [Actinoplanes lutulentus]
MTEAPPWAVTPEQVQHEQVAQPFGGVVPPYGSPENKHGQLLVRFPGEVHGSARPPAPSWRPVVGWTFFFSVLGVVPAMRRAGRARRYGRERAPYWIAFGTTLVIATAFWSALTYSVALPVYDHFEEKSLTTALEDTILDDGRIAKSVGATVSNPQCTPEGDRGSDGLRTYVCTFTLVADGETTSLFVDADLNSNWEIND